MKGGEVVAVVIMFILMMVPAFLMGVFYHSINPEWMVTTASLDNYNVTLSDHSSVYVNYNNGNGNPGIQSSNSYYVTELAKGSESMAPTISSDDVVILTTNFTEADLRVGNIIAFESTIYTPYKALLHRIIRIDGDKIYTKGDNNNYIDEGYIKKENVKALLVGILYR